MSSPGFEPRSNGTAVSVANHYTGWATVFTPYLFVLISSDCDEFCLLEDVRPEGGIGKLQDVVRPHQVEPRLVLVHRVQDCLRYQQRTTENIVIMGSLFEYIIR
ncbi:hypothetical protein TNCV_1288271 [Trichonephila clavipes]|nr:hypothetical protein TNCV_1288271 [Trichonephila clavipes]